MGSEISIGQLYNFVGYAAKFGECLMVPLHYLPQYKNNSYSEVIIHEQSNRRYKQCVEIDLLCEYGEDRYPSGLQFVSMVRIRNIIMVNGYH
ncbi:hypothetical protein CN482_23420 [Bacillus cereus]|nr:hypothetical protein CN482_23420 [Bacillus cereus]